MLWQKLNTLKTEHGNQNMNNDFKIILETQPPNRLLAFKSKQSLLKECFPQCLQHIAKR